MTFHDSDKLSLGTLFHRAWKKVSITWMLTLLETAVLTGLPLAIGWTIDGLLADNFSPFLGLMGLFAIILLIATSRRVYDTRVYGTLRVDLGKTQAMRDRNETVSVTNARVLMGRELVDFLEHETPAVVTAFVQVTASVLILWLFHSVLAAVTVVTTIVILMIYNRFATWFFDLNRSLNEQSEQQVQTLENRTPKKIAAHFNRLRNLEVRLSDAESLVYGFIFAVLLTMLGFNIWFASTRLNASPGSIFSIVTYSLEFLQAAVTLPAALQGLTRMTEITQRINQSWTHGATPR